MKKSGRREVDTMDIWVVASQMLGGGFKYLLFSPLFGEDFQFGL